MDLREKVRTLLQSIFQPERMKITNGEGIIGYIVSPRFRQMEAFDRQTLIHEALHQPVGQLSAEEIKQIHAIAALTSEEFIAHDLE